MTYPARPASPNGRFRPRRSNTKTAFDMSSIYAQDARRERLTVTAAAVGKTVVYLPEHSRPPAATSEPAAQLRSFDNDVNWTRRVRAHRRLRLPDGKTALNRAAAPTTNFSVAASSMAQSDANYQEQ